MHDMMYEDVILLAGENKSRSFWRIELSSSFLLEMTNEDDCVNRPAGEDNFVGEYTDEEITLWGRDVLLKIPMINSVGMNYHCW